MKPTTERPARIRRTTVMETPGFLFTVTHTNVGLWLPGEAPIDRVPLVFTPDRTAPAGRREWPVGTKFFYMGSSKTSAFFESLDFRDFEPLTYRGICQDFDTFYACFTCPSQPGGFWAWVHIGSELCWGTPSLSARVLSMNRVLCERPDGVCEWFPLPSLRDSPAETRRRSRRKPKPDDDDE
jgi:hypothetical protein